MPAGTEQPVCFSPIHAIPSDSIYIRTIPFTNQSAVNIADFQSYFLSQSTIRGISLLNIQMVYRSGLEPLIAIYFPATILQ